jgi:hypothetical protein
MFQKKWDYLIVTASNRSQTIVYENQLKIRRELGLLTEVRNILVVPDFEDKRIGSGGSTILCLNASRPIPGLPSGVRLQFHLSAPGQPLRPAGQF